MRRSPSSSHPTTMTPIFLIILLLTSSSFASAFNYTDALTKSILFFEGQRSGKLPANQRLNWRGDSGLRDGFSANVDLVGGYYDAGDNLKFGLPMAFTTTMLAWSIIEFGGEMKSELGNAKAALRWGSDYLLKAATATPGTLYVQVGEPHSDHQCWERPEDMDTSRSVYKVSSENPGSDVAAETAAALAAASIVFKDSDPYYSRQLIQTALKVFTFADVYRGSYSDSLDSAVCPFYCSYSGYYDDLLWGAAWMYRATKDDRFKNYIEANGKLDGSETDDFFFSWDDKRAGTKILLTKSYFDDHIEEFKSYKDHAFGYICSMIPGSENFQAEYTPGGLLYKQDGSNLQYVTSASFLMLTFAKYLVSVNINDPFCGEVTTDTLIGQAKKQIDYILGNNPVQMSYMVGFGDKYPIQVHHRGSSIPSVRDHSDRVSCDAGHMYFNSASRNPNVLVGAIVGGPNRNDNYADDRSNYAQTEPATYINAPFVGAVAFLAAQSN